LSLYIFLRSSWASSTARFWKRLLKTLCVELLKISASPTDSSASPLALHCSYGPSPPPGAPSSSSSPALHSLKQYLAGVGSTPRWAKTPVRWS